MSERPVINASLSWYLDVLRFGAALVVLLSHWAYTRFTGGTYGFIRDWNLGSDAVVLFFVLSGFVITYAATCKDRTAKRFAFSRLTRLWSVAIPALAITLILDGLGVNINPDFYLDSPFYNPTEGWTYWVRGLTFSNHWGGQNIRLGSNGPYWSLSYEAAYYLIFGIVLYLRKAARLLALLFCVFIFGFKILLLAPAWFMGVGLYFAFQNMRHKDVSPALLMLMIFVPIGLYVTFQLQNLPETLRGLTYILLGHDNYLALGFSDEFLWNALLGGLFTIHLMGAGLLFAQKPDFTVASKSVKWLAGGSFSLYLVHYPVLQWLGATLPKTEWPILNHVCLLIGTIFICYTFAAFFERPLPRYRALMKRIMYRNIPVQS
ncbi:acyltransferase family protein [Litorimonas sp. WD9-15]|uniref:acyltransferase family protein n=1 Tax=Litorimonas sp. WD9-15 TaxID=3418716 RepID=UPI003D0015B8